MTPPVRNIAVLNRSKDVTDREGAYWTAALQKDADARFLEDWGIKLVLRFIGKTDLTGWQGAANVVLLDTSDEANALGYHEETPEGLPRASIFVRTCYDDHASITVCLGHEVYELAADPYTQLLAPSPSGYLVAYENCDPVEADELGVKVDGCLQSAYVLPRFFDPTAKGGRFDSAGALSQPFELAAGGYLSYTKTWPPKWQQAFADQRGPETSGPHADRELIRQVPMHERRRSHTGDPSPA